ncbi:MAG: helix-turn-helix transcriptional regulator [Synergistaceae bacterium]|nr:helix-turn-helix transcriptional regulator [Synergistaceae bacterium]
MIGSKILALRKARKLSRRQVAELCGFSKDSLRRWEKGLLFPRLDEFLRLADLLGVKAGELLE